MRHCVHSTMVPLLAVGLLVTSSAGSTGQEVRVGKPPEASPKSPRAQPPTEDKPQNPRHAEIVASIRTAYGRAGATKDQARQHLGYRHAKRLLAEQVEANRDHHAFVIELLTLQEQLSLRIGDYAAVKEAALRLHQVLRSKGGRDGLAEWVVQHANRLRSIGRCEQAIFHLSELTRADPDSPAKARYELLIGDILAQKAYPDGPFDAAITQYARVAEQYRRSSPDHAADARLRQAKMLWLNDQTAQAEAIFTELSANENEAIAEMARHYEMLSEIGEKKLRDSLRQNRAANDTTGESK